MDEGVDVGLGVHRGDLRVAVNAVRGPAAAARHGTEDEAQESLAATREILLRVARRGVHRRTARLSRPMQQSFGLASQDGLEEPAVLTHPGVDVFDHAPHVRRRRQAEQLAHPGVVADVQRDVDGATLGDRMDGDDVRP